MTPDGDTAGEATCRAQAHHTIQGEGPPRNALQWEHLCPSGGQKLLQSAYTGKHKQQRRGGATSLGYYNWLGKWQPDNNFNDKNGKPHARRARVTSVCQSFFQPQRVQGPVHSPNRGDTPHPSSLLKCPCETSSCPELTPNSQSTSANPLGEHFSSPDTSKVSESSREGDGR